MPPYPNIKIQLSIVTINFNNYKGLKKTIQSFLDLGFVESELVVIDGASTDESANYLKSLSDKRIKFISEADEGIYNAMNKGINRVSGEWVIFMNSGDTFLDKNCIPVIEKSDADIIYGSARIHYNDGFERVLIPNELKHLWRGMSFSHQAVFCRTDLLKKKRFSEEYQFCADFNLLYSSYLEGLNFELSDKIIANIEAGGVSDSKRHKATAEVFKINKRLNNRFIIYPYFILKIMYGYLSSGFKKVMPQSFINFMVKSKYK